MHPSFLPKEIALQTALHDLNQQHNHFKQEMKRTLIRMESVAHLLSLYSSSNCFGNKCIFAPIGHKPVELLLF